MNRKRIKVNKRSMLTVGVIGLLAVLFVLMIVGGQYTLQNQLQDDIEKDEFAGKFRAFYRSLLHYIYQPPVIGGICAALALFLWILARLFFKYFNMFPPGMVLDFILSPKALESIPHSIMVLFIYYAFLKNADSLRFIMLVSFALVSVPFIYKMVEDAFITAKKEGIVENYLVLPIPDWKIVGAFLKQNVSQVLVVPFVFFVILVTYWEFLYSSIGISGDEKSAPGIFYNNYNDGYLINFPEAHNNLITIQIGLLATIVIVFLYIVYNIKKTRINPPVTARQHKRVKKDSHASPGISTESNILVSCNGLTVGTPAIAGTPPGNENIIIRDINLDIKKGENICIMGESGSGKTTLVREIAGILPPALQRKNGTIENRGSTIFTIFQDVDLYMDPYQTLFYYVKKAFKKRNSRMATRPAGPVIDNRVLLRYTGEIGLLKPLLEGVAHDVDARAINKALETDHRQEIDRITRLLLKGLRTKTRQKLSGGEKQKFYLLIACIVKPDILIADEIFTDVDRESGGKIVNLLFKTEFTVVFISHDIGMVKDLVAKKQLRKVFYLNGKTFHPHVWEYDMPPWARDMWQAHQKIKDEARNVTAHKPEEESGTVFEIGKVIRKFEDGNSVKFVPENGDRPLVIRKGINYALIGENGSGKTTLFKILAKLYRYEGNIKVWNGRKQDLLKASRYRCAGQNQLVFQKTGNSIVEKSTIKEYLLSFFKKGSATPAACTARPFSHVKAIFSNSCFFSKHLQGVNKKSDYPDIEKRINDLIVEFFSKDKLKQILGRRFKELSVGEQRRILLIRALLLVNPEGILFIDEAMRGMDVFLKERLVRYLKKKDLQIFLISHDRLLVDALCREKITLEHDKKTRNTIIKAHEEA